MTRRKHDAFAMRRGDFSSAAEGRWGCLDVTSSPGLASDWFDFNGILSLKASVSSLKTAQFVCCGVDGGNR